MRFLRSLAFAIASVTALVCALAAPSVLANTRVTTYSQEQPSSPNTNLAVRYQRIADGTFMAAMLGPFATSGTYWGLTVTPVSGLTVDVAPTTSGGTGAVFQLLADDPSAWASGPYNSGLALAADSTKIVLQGVVQSGTAALTVTAPATAGQTQDALVECSITVTDNASQSATFVYDAAGDTTPQTVNQNRADLVSCQVKEGTAAATGSQTVPAVDSGFVAIGYVAVPTGTSTITTGMIAASPAYTDVMSVAAGSNVVVGGTAFAPTVAVTAAPSFTTVIANAYQVGSAPWTVSQNTTAGFQGYDFADGSGAGTGIRVDRSANTVQNPGLMFGTTGTSTPDWDFLESTNGGGNLIAWYSSAITGNALTLTTAGALTATASVTTPAVTVTGMTGSAKCVQETAGALVASSFVCGPAFTTPVQGASVGGGTGLQTYIAPVYNYTGTATTSSEHTVIYSCTFAAATSCLVTLTGTSTGQFASATSYACSPPDMGTSSTYVGFTVGTKAAGSFKVWASASNSDTVYGICTGN